MQLRYTSLLKSKSHSRVKWLGLCLVNQQGTLCQRPVSCYIRTIISPLVFSAMSRTGPLVDKPFMVNMIRQFELDAGNLEEWGN